MNPADYVSIERATEMLQQLAACRKARVADELDRNRLVDEFAKSLEEVQSAERRARAQLSALVTAVDGLLTGFRVTAETRTVEIVGGGLFLKLLSLKEVLELARSAAR